MLTNREFKYSDRHFYAFHPKRLIIISIAIFLITLTLHIYQVSLSKRLVLQGNELSHLKLLHSIVFYHTFTINPKYTDTSYINGKYFSNKPPGYAFFLTPPFYIYTKIVGDPDMKRKLWHTFLFVKISNAILSSLTAVCIFLFLSTFKLSSVSVFFGLASAISGTLFPAYSTLANSIPLSLFLIIFSLLFFRLSEIQKDYMLLQKISLFAAMYATTVDYSNGFVLFPLIVLLFIKAVKQRKVINFVLCAFIPLGLLSFYNYHVFGSIFVVTYSYYAPPYHVPWSGVKNAMLLKNMPNGLYGLLISPSRGLFLLSPVTIFGAIASLNFLKSKNWNLFLVSLLAFSGIIIMSTYTLWHGGHSIGYRHILPSAVILGMLSSFYLKQYNGKRRVIALFLLLISSFTGIMSFFIQLDRPLLLLTWKAEPADIHANFFTELLWAYIKKIF